MQHIINLIQLHKLALFMTVVTALPVIYFHIIQFQEYLKPSPTAGDTTFDGLEIWVLCMGIIGILAVGVIIFYWFSLGIRWLFILMIVVAPLLYLVALFVAGWLAFIPWFVWTLLRYLVLTK